MHLPTTEITHQVVRAADLDQLVERLSGRRYAAATTAGGPLRVEGNLHDAATARRWMATGGPAPHPQVLLNALAHQGFIEDGDYLVKS